MGERSDIMMHVKVSVEQWDTFLAPMSKGRRSAYIREAVTAYAMHHPVITAIPLGEPTGIAIRPQPIQVLGNETLATWIEQIPLLFRSYMVRHCLRWYRERPQPDQRIIEQPTFFEQVRTGTEP